MYSFRLMFSILISLFLIASCKGGSNADSDGGDKSSTESDAVPNGTDDTPTDAPNTPDGTDPMPDGTDDETLPPVDVKLKGAVDKGPFVLGSSVAISPVDKQTGSPTGQVFNTQTTSDLGEFEVEFEYRGLVSLEANGFYYNEATGALSNAPITLRAYYEVTEGGNQSAYINLFTHLTYNRIKNLISDGTSFLDAMTQAETELRAALEIGPPDFDPEATGIEMNVTGGESKANAYLFAVSAVLAERAALDGGPIDAALQELLNGIAVDFADDGDIDPETKDGIWEAQFTIDVEKVMNMLAERLADTGSDAGVPDINTILDLDRDGAVNRDDCLIFDPYRYTGHADLDEDGHDHYRCGGDDLDDDCAACFPGGTPVCGEARDHDQDGVLDERSGCGSCTPGTPRILTEKAIFAQDIFAVGNTLYAASNELVILDITDKDAPQEIGRYGDMPANGLTVLGDAVYLIGENGLSLVDVSDPSSPLPLGFADTPGADLVVSGGFVFTDRGDFVDISNPLMPMPYKNNSNVDDEEMLPSKGAVFRLNNLLMFADAFGTIRIIDIDATEGPMHRGSLQIDASTVPITSDPMDPNYIPGGDPLDMPMEESGAALFAKDDYLYYAVSFGLVVVDISTPDAPSAVGYSEHLFGLKDLFVVDQIAYVAGDQGLFALDVSDPAFPTIIAGPIGEGMGLSALFVANDTVYAGGSEGLLVVDLDCDGEPMVVCGNGRADFGEGCDNEDFAGQSCGAFGYSVGELACTDRCDIDKSACTNCGNNQVDFGVYTNPDEFNPDNPDGKPDVYIDENMEQEECDGNDLNGQECQWLGFGAGTLRCDDSCRFDTSQCVYVCGDWRLDPGEDCERNWDPWGEDDLNGHTCTDFGFANESGLRCTDQCGFDTSGCLPVCGNGLFEPGEACENDNLDGKTCADFGFVASDGLACTQCEFDFTGCTAECGNSIIEPVEDCEGSDLGDATCEALGYADPAGLSCGNDCLFDDSGCTAVCGNEVVEPGETCDDGNTDPDDGCTPDCAIEAGWQCLGTPSVCDECPAYYHGDACDRCVILVDPAQEDSETDGLSWSTAFASIQEALEQKEDLDESCEIWVAKGTLSLYKKSAEESLRLPSNTAIYGGFAGTESSRDMRERNTHETVLDGKGPGAEHLNSVLRLADAAHVRIDGFTIQGGFSDGMEGGGGVHMMQSDVTFADCLFKNNKSTGDGGALYANNTTLTLINTRFEENQASRGGALYTAWSTVTMTDCTLTLNNATDSGGALLLAEHSEGIVTSTTFDTNHAFNGGAMAGDWGSRVRVKDSVFTENRSEDMGGAVTAMWETRQQFENTVFIGNASRRGGAMGVQGENFIELVNCTVAGNIGYDSGGGFGGEENARINIINSIVFHNEPSAAGSQLNLDVTFSNVQGGIAGEGNINADPLFVDLDNGDLHLSAGSPSIDAALGKLAPANDSAGYPRYDDPDTVDTGIGETTYADMGALEFHTCGNGTREGNESCEEDDLGGNLDCTDLGFVSNGALSCTEFCSYDLGNCAAVCGNDTLEPTEECDGTHLDDTTCTDLGFETEGALSCGDDCRFDISECTAACGNDIIEPTEACEGFDLNGESCESLGFNDGTLSCTEACQFNVSECNQGCGNDRWEGWWDENNQPQGEECDGTDFGGSDCWAYGLCGEISCNDDCTHNLDGCYECCGNNMIDMDEECDGDNTWGSCMDHGFSGGELKCGEDCKYDTSNCFYVCGNGMLEGEEACDMDEIPLSCEDLGYTGGGEPGCTEQCTIDESECLSICDNDVLEPNETCETGNLNGESCESLGFVNGGVLACTGCQFDTSECIAECGNSVIEPGETCETDDMDGKTCRDFGYVNETGLICTDCELDDGGCTAACGNGVIEPGETCDDGNNADSDGCSGSCLIEDGWKCLGALSDCDQCEPYFHGDNCDECIIHVDRSDTITERDGASWDTALDDIQGAIEMAVQMEANCAVWVKTGTYYVYKSSTGDRLIPRNGTRLYGGFNGNERHPSERNLKENRTVLSAFNGPTRSHRVESVINIESDRNIVIDGFTIVAAGENDWGSALRIIWNGEASVNNCHLRSSAPFDAWPGAVYIGDGQLSMTNSIIEGFNNNAMSLESAEVTLTHTTIANNNPMGISMMNNTHVRVVNSIIFGNSADGIDGDGDVEVSYSLVQGFSGVGNVEGDPMFVDPGKGDYSLSPGSPAIDAADGNHAVDLDMNGFARFDDGETVDIGVGTPTYADMGALEYTLCGNGTLDTGEFCDGDFAEATDCTDLGYMDPGVLLCLNTCLFNTRGCEAVCNNGTIEPGEACDGSLPETMNCQDIGYANAGTLICDPNTCQYDESGCEAVCGNDVVERTESCEGENLNGESCESQGFKGGDLSCFEDCSFNLSECTGGCGNNLLETPEQCDGTALNDMDCTFFGGFTAGDLGCNADCTFDLSECGYECGNGFREGDEECDDWDMAGKDCTDLGYGTSGNLACSEGCTFDTSGCTPTCGNSLLEPTEACETGDLNGADCTTLGYVNPEGLACTGCQLDDSGCAAVCGNDALEPTEACDGPHLDGADCTDLGYADPDTLSCTNCEYNTTGCIADCGNGVVEPGEACDDSNEDPNDGCSDNCQISNGYQCLGSPSRCDECADYFHGPSCDRCVVVVDRDERIETRDGKQWNTAMASIKEAMAQAMSLGSRCEIWVAGGTYYMLEQSDQDRLTLESGISLYGGFAGTESLREQRVLGDNETILDGRSNDSNSLRVAVIMDAEWVADVVVDGFTFKNAGSWEDGAGIRIMQSWMTVSNSTFDRIAEPDAWAGAIRVDQSNMTLENVIITNVNGPGLINQDSNLIVRGCTIAGSNQFGIRNSGSTSIYNSIIFFNEQGGIEQQQGTVTAQYSDIQNWGSLNGNINMDPMFVDLEAGDVRLQEGSPCIDAADGDAASDTDRYSRPRYDDPTVTDTGTGSPAYVDMGALEISGCGNGILDTMEMCDGNVTDQTCQDVGYADVGEVTCLANCRLNTALCKSSCGNSTIEPGEQCEGTDIGEATCVDIGYVNDGNLTCDPATCTFNADGCEPVCNNGKREPGEVCEGEDVGGATCESEGFVNGGWLFCNSDCTLNVNDCWGGCGNNQIEENEECDGTNIPGGCWDVGLCGDVNCTDACKLDYTNCTACPEP